MVTASSECKQGHEDEGMPLNCGWEVFFSRDVGDFLLLVV